MNTTFDHVPLVNCFLCISKWDKVCVCVYVCVCVCMCVCVCVELHVQHLAEIPTHTTWDTHAPALATAPTCV